MKTNSSFFTVFFIVSIILAFGLACKFSTTSDSAKESKKETPKENKETPKPANSTSTTPAESKSSAKDIAGDYWVSGTYTNGGNDYSGDLTITKRGEVYQFSWDVEGKKYDGVGVQTDNVIGVSYTEGTNGEGCGVQLYKTNFDGSLDGKSGYWGNDNSESEKAVRTSGDDLVGEYDVTGKNPDGEEYESKLTVMPSGPGFIFNWVGANSFEGLGVRTGSFVTVGFGGKQCSFVAYEVKPDRSMEGKFGGLGTVTFGTEKAVYKGIPR